MLVLSAHPARGADDVAPARLAEEESRPGERPTGTAALLASAAYPGLGQLLNEDDTKAAFVGAAEAFLIARLVLEDRRTRNSLRMYRQTGDREYFDAYSDHFDRRQSLVWWAAIVALYAVADAYVDAHLGEFDDTHAAVSGGLSGGTGRTADGVRLGIWFSF
jgi:hypothetical protein